MSPDREATPADEADLVARLRANDPAAFERLVRLHAPPLLAATRRMLRNEDDARDALQETFLAATRSIGAFEGESSLATWLHRIAVNAALMRIRSRRRAPEVSIEELLPAFQADGHAARPSGPWIEGAERAAERAETRALVLESIARLPDSHRTVLVLRDVERLDTATVAGVLGIESNAVKVRLHRARQALRALLDPHFSRTERAPSDAVAGREDR